ncbi:uncharacterized protein LTR77_003460 [Saxophila tyrrhenica]|uniref:Uncharacterized protein n=1 Tax=Saxophila tyrrhenica TaxID=1690608 RepID=A0AAV9PH40_9PEZI|nr:hypothetical protein LTR77_003460 [Saxophila tyrrhenica]
MPTTTKTNPNYPRTPATPNKKKVRIDPVGKTASDCTWQRRTPLEASSGKDKRSSRCERPPTPQRRRSNAGIIAAVGLSALAAAQQQQADSNRERRARGKSPGRQRERYPQQPVPRSPRRREGGQQGGREKRQEGGRGQKEGRGEDEVARVVRRRKYTVYL